jgi:hypothetical protein
LKFGGTAMKAYPHHTPASSRTFAKNIHDATGLKYGEIIELLDRHCLGLDPT